MRRGRHALLVLAALGIGGCCDVARYVDDDGDGFGDPDTLFYVCDEAVYPKEAAEAGDCDDADETAYPGAEELCDGVDNDCDDRIDEGVGEAIDGWLDDDGDGYGGSTAAVGCPGQSGFSEDGGDCDDADELVHPGADEVCDDADNDCDARVDEEPVDGDTYYVDADNDTYGDPEAEVIACAAGGGVSANSDDCDDSDRLNAPGARERCDDVDNDCDDVVDEDADPVDWYPDGDGDGYGAGEGTESCSSPGDDYADNADDCDDSDSSVNPGAEEICLDGVDNDCSGDGAGCELSGDYLLDASADLIYVGSVANGELGYLGRSGRGDHDGDGVNDLLVGAYAANSDAGQSVVLDMSLSGVQSTASAFFTVDGDSSGDELGVSQAWLGDHDGDGVDDVAVSAWRVDSGNANDVGEVYVFGGPLSGSAPGDADAVLTGSTRSDYFGTRVAGPGDLDGDGMAELLVGAYGDDAGGNGSGSAFLWFGPVPSGADSSADVILTGETSNDQAGYHVAGADLTGDSVRDLLVSAVQADGLASSSGAVYLVSGDQLQSGSLADAHKIGGAASGDYFGWSAEDIGDQDGDGYNDLLVGAYAANNSAGRVFLFNGPISGDLDTSDADHGFVGGSSGDLLGVSVSPAGDVNRDGYADMLIGAYGASVSGANNATGQGVGYLFYGPVAGWQTISTPGARFIGTDRYDSAGGMVQDIGDADGDGVDDLVIGAFGAGSSDEGKVYLFYGGAP